MSFYDDASLIVYPSGYKESKIYAQKPVNGTGDLTFTRASSATRVNEQGLIETPSILNTTELVNNGDFATDTGWNKNANWSISGGVAIADGTSSSDINQGPPLASVGAKYLISFDVVSLSQGSFRVEFGDASIDGNTVGSFSGEVIATSTDRVRVLAISTAIGSIDNVSVKELITSNIPRIDYSNGCGSLLLEKQSTNLVTYSEDFSNAYWTKNGSSVVSGFTSPDGTTNAFKLVGDLANSFKNVTKLNVSVTNALNYTYSAFAKADTSDYLQLICSGGFASNHQNFDLANGVLGTSSGVVSSRIEAYSNGWYKCSMTVLATSTAGTNAYIVLADSASMGRAAGFTTASGVYIYGAQLEQSSYPTSYIPTSGTTTTRIADTASKTGLSSVINSTEGVLYAEIAALADDGTARYLSISDGSFTNRVSIYLSSSTNIIGARVVVGGTSIFLNGASQTQANSNKIAIKWKLNDYQLYINGLEVAANTSGNTFTSSTLSQLSFNDGGTGTAYLFGKCQNLMVFPSALTDDELTDLTGAVHQTFNSLATFYNYTIL